MNIKIVTTLIIAAIVSNGAIAQSEPESVRGKELLEKMDRSEIEATNMDDAIGGALPANTSNNTSTNVDDKIISCIITETAATWREMGKAWRCRLLALAGAKHSHAGTGAPSGQRASSQPGLNRSALRRISITCWASSAAVPGKTPSGSGKVGGCQGLFPTA